jgi:DeoR/GlpR family transcriptional regulator of sugar metabolism
LSSINVQKAVLSIAGADRRGYYNSNLLLVETERAMMQCADQTIVVADSSKFGHSSLARLCRLSEVQTVVVDDALEECWQDELRKAGVQLLMATIAAETKPNELEVTAKAELNAKAEVNAKAESSAK